MLDLKSDVDVPEWFFVTRKAVFCFQDSSEDDLSGKGPKKLAFGSRTSIRRSTEPSTSEESKEGDDSESGGDGGAGRDEKGKKAKKGEKGAKNGEKDVKSDKEKIKGATMTTPKKVGTNKFRKSVAVTKVVNSTLFGELLAKKWKLQIVHICATRQQHWHTLDHKL